MNIPGPEKDSPLIRRGAALGRKLLEKGFLTLGFAPLHQETNEAFTGVESFYVLPLPPLTVKRMTADIEEATPAGRIFDLDVICPDGTKVERQEVSLPGRRCLICGQPAQACARARTHTVSELREKVDALLHEALRDDIAKEAARLACQALLYEVNTTPKPGLVDRMNSGSHRDMDIFTFARSTPALYPYFAHCAEIGYDMAELAAPDTFRALRRPGRLAEADMLYSTDGVNTHKGAIFSLGILCAAAGRLGSENWNDPEALLKACAAMTAGLTEKDFAGLTLKNAKTVGQQLFAQYGITGVRGEAEAGFPLALHFGLPKLEAGLAAGLTANEAGCAALIAIMARNTDTNVIHRSSLEGQKKTAAYAADLLQKEPFPKVEALREFDEMLIAENISPGGSADLLAMCWMLHFMKEEA